MHQRATHVSFKIGDWLMHKWDRTRKHQPFFEPNPYVKSEINGNMITVTRNDRSTTRNSRFLKSITGKMPQRSTEISRHEENMKGCLTEIHATSNINGAVWGHGSIRTMF